MNLNLNKWETPPIEKIHEAYSAIIDNRIKLFEGYATVSSSDFVKDYRIEWNGNEYSSNDNASYWTGKLGYPVIALLMIQGKLDYNPEMAKHFSGINWKKLNTAAKNNWSIVVEKIMNDLKDNGVDTDVINQEIDKVYEQIKSLDITYKKSRLLPPK